MKDVIYKSQTDLHPISTYIRFRAFSLPHSSCVSHFPGKSTYFLSSKSFIPVLYIHTHVCSCGT